MGLIYEDLWAKLIAPLVNLLLGLGVGIFIANVLEALHWTKFLSKLSQPLANKAHLGPTSSAAFTLAFLSPSQANALLSEEYAKGALPLRELLLTQVFMSLPSYLLHLPGIFCLTYPVLGVAAFIYLGLSFCAAVLRTLGTFFLARFLLPEPKEQVLAKETYTKLSCTQVLQTSWRRLRKRLPKLCLYTIPIYILIYTLQVTGVFANLNSWFSNLGILREFLAPQACSIIVLSLLAELGSALGASAAILSTQSLSSAEVILALLLGNILATPMRALRHQLPAYAGYYNPGLGLKLIVLTQTLRALSLLLVTVLFAVSIR
ncbi:MAG: hypothetical protein IJU79_00585 [Desulfovibrionaceae bacterium]|nr:hypothetical protein [Desulfovibrionaceae bacterium]